MAPRVMRGPRPLPTWSGRQRKGTPRCSSGGSPSRAATFAGAAAAAAAAAVAPSSWQPHREPSFKLPVGHDSSAVVAKVVVDHSSAGSSSGYCSPRDEVSTTSLQPPCMSSPSGCSPQQPGLATCVPDADGADAVVGASSGNPSAALPSSLPEEEEPLSPALQMEVALPEEEPLSPTLRMEVALQMVVAKFILFYLDAHEKRMLSTDDVKSLSPAFKMEVAIEILFRLDLARKKRILSDDELDLIIHLKSQLPCLEAEIGEVNAHGADVFVVEEEEEEEEEEEKEPLSPSLKMTAALKIMFRLDLAREMRILSVDELDLYDDMKSILPRLEAEIGEDNADGADAVKEEEEDNADGAHAVEEEEVVVEEEEEEEEPLSPALQKEVAIEILFHFDLARKKRTLSAGELDLIIFLKSQLARLEVEIGEVNDDDDEEDEEDGEEEPLSPALEMEYALKVMFRLDLAREMRILSADELDLYDDMKFLLTRLEADIGKDNANGVDVVEGEEEDDDDDDEDDNANGADVVEEEEEPLSPALQKEVAIEILFCLDLARKKRTLSAGELDQIIFLKSQLAHLEAEIGEVNEEEEEEEEPLLPALRMEAALKVMFRLDLAREMRTLSADELDLYDDMKSLLPRLEAEIREVAAAPSIALEDPPSCQPHAPSVALAGANAVPSPMVPGASTSINLSADLQLPERSVVVTNAELSTQGPEAMPSALKSSAEPEPAVEDDEITEALYGHSVRRRRLPIFRDICPE